MRLRHTLAAPLLIAALTLVGCSSDSGSDAKKDDATTTAAPDEATTTAAGGTETTAAEGGEGGAETVDIADFAFDPDALDVKVGDTVTFTNKDSAKHTATSDDGAPEAFDTDDLAQDDSADVTFDTAGDYKYHCTIHDYMTATITVAE